MTIALGVLSAGGIVLAADTEISLEPFKGDGKKIPFWFDVDANDVSRGGLAITGAGDTDYLEILAAELYSVFSLHPEALMDDLEGLFRIQLKRFYREHVLPFAPHPEMWLIIAAKRDGECRLWKTSRNSIKRVGTFAVAGLGQLQALRLLGLLSLPSTSIVAAQIVAAYVAFQVKQSTGYTGEDTDLIVFGEEQHGPDMGLDRECVRALEESFRRYARLDAYLFNSVVGNGFFPQNRIDEETVKVRQQFEQTLARHGLGDFSREVLSKFRRSTHDPSGQPPSPE